tara:strand:- start:275 stop:475 length:201 start_codon:yes stop_codon:yes gene_type:complete
MKTVILCGGLGTRLCEETHLKLKPMIEIGGRPILWHINISDFGNIWTQFVTMIYYKKNGKMAKPNG